jgi:hypothetical protein
VRYVEALIVHRCEPSVLDAALLTVLYERLLESVLGQFLKGGPSTNQQPPALR